MFRVPVLIEFHVPVPRSCSTFLFLLSSTFLLHVEGHAADRRRRLQEDVQLCRLRDAAEDVLRPEDSAPQHRTGTEGGAGQRRDQAGQRRGQWGSRGGGGGIQVRGRMGAKVRCRGYVVTRIELSFNSPVIIFYDVISWVIHGE